MENKPVAEQDIGRQLLQETAAYAESSVCRRKFLLNYFGEIYPKDNCGNCDNCLHPKKKIEAQRPLEIVLDAVAEVKENFMQDYIIDFVKGRATDDIVSHKHNELECFGAGEDENPKVWNPVIRQAIIAGYLKKDVENYGLLKLTAEGRRFRKKPRPFQIVLDNEFNFSEDEEELGEGRGNALPPYVIFMDVSLEQMATLYPVKLEELQNIQGVGAGKARKFGKPFVELIRKHCEENDIERPEDMRIRTVAKKSMLKVKIIKSIDAKMALDDIAIAEGIDFEELLDEIDTIVYSGTKLNIDYFLEEVMDEDHVDEIYGYFMESETDDLEVAMKELGSEYEEDEIRLVRVKFLSEKAN